LSRAEELLAAGQDALAVFDCAFDAGDKRTAFIAAYTRACVSLACADADRPNLGLQEAIAVLAACADRLSRGD